MKRLKAIERKLRYRKQREKKTLILIQVDNERYKRFDNSEIMTVEDIELITSDVDTIIKVSRAIP